MLILQGWNGANCTDDVDECSVNDAVCGHKTGSKCTNTIGSYACPCRPGYYDMDENCFGMHQMCLPKSF